MAKTNKEKIEIELDNKENALSSSIETNSTNIDYKALKDKVNELKPKVDGTSNAKSTAQVEKGKKTETTKSTSSQTSTTNPAQKPEPESAEKNSSEKYTDDQLASLSPAAIQEWKDIIDEYQPTKESKTKWDKAHKDFNDA